MTGTEAYCGVLRRIMYLVVEMIFCGSNQAKVFAYEGDGVDRERLDHSLIPENHARAAKDFEKYTGLDQSDISVLSAEDTQVWAHSVRLYCTSVSVVVNILLHTCVLAHV
jgi:hypothetical protein